MDARIQDLPFDPAALQGLSEALLRHHFQHHYRSAVQRLNTIRAQLRAREADTLPAVTLHDLKREELVATNSMLLHELYFNSLGPAPKPLSPAMDLALSASFGSAARWRAEFVAMGHAMGAAMGQAMDQETGHSLDRGAGWVVLSFLLREGRLVNQWAADPSQALAGGIPLLALDMDEHAYQRDFGAAAGPYVDAFMQNIDWARVAQRYQQAVTGSSDELGATAAAAAGARLIDVRRAAAFEQSDALIEGAGWRDPAQVDAWSRQLAAGTPVVVYCVYGHEVSRGTALRLRAAGVDARFLIGGFDAWRAQGRPVMRKSGV